MDYPRHKTKVDVPCRGGLLEDESESLLQNSRVPIGRRRLLRQYTRHGLRGLLGPAMLLPQAI